MSYDEDVIESHGYSEWSTSNSSVRPVAVVYPRSTEDVSLIAKICNKYNGPMGKWIVPSSLSHWRFLLGRQAMNVVLLMTLWLSSSIWGRFKR